MSFVALFLMGMLGVAVLFALAPGAVSVVEIALLAIGTAVGVALAERVGLVSLVAEKAAFGTPIVARLRPQVVPAVAIGLVVGATITVLDYGFALAMGADLGAATPTYPVELVAVGLSYGAITEELLLRWGLMTLLLWIGWRLSPPRDAAPGPLLAWTAIVLAAILFGVGHLPALAASAELTPPLVARTIALNALAGIAYGWAFWRRSLEAGMITHAATHIGFFVAIPVVGSVLIALTG
jgi:hypothetical protein